MVDSSMSGRIGEQFGALVKEYPATRLRYAWFVVCAWIALGVFNGIGQGDWGSAFFLLALIAGIAAFYYYRLRNVHAWLYQWGFVITRGDKTTSGRWEDIASVQHRVTTYRYYFVIPVGRSHTYAVVMNNGEKARITSAFSNGKQLGEEIQRQWATVMVAKRAQQIQQTQQ